jgi:hypothetical protein
MDRAHLAPPGGDVRCAKCLAVWFHAVSEKDVALDLDRDEAPLITSGGGEAGRETPAGRSTQTENRTRLALVAGWGALVIFCGTFVWAAIAFRHEIATVWPQSSSFYALINFPVNIRGLAFAEIGHDRLIEDGQTVLRISGRIINISERELIVPAIYVSLRDGEERELYGWTLNANVATLGPGQSSPFLVRLPNPPAEMVRTELSFASGTLP